MKIWTIAAAVGLSLSGAVGAATPPATITDPAVIVGSTEPTPESPAIARKEARAALAQAKQSCRHEPDGNAQETCLTQARDDYNHMMAMADADGTMKKR